MRTYQRVYVPMGQHAGEQLRLYGFVRIVDGRPERTHCCSMTPLVWVEPIGWDTPDEGAQDEVADGGYFAVRAVESSLADRPEAYDSEDEAREAFQGNW